MPIALALCQKQQYLARNTRTTKPAGKRLNFASSRARPMVLYLTHQLYNARLGVNLTTAMDSEQHRQEHSRSPSCSPLQQSPRSGHEPESPSSSPLASPARQCVADAKPPKFPAAVTGASSSKPPQAAAPQPTHTSFMISDILHSTCSSKNVRHPQTTTTYISTSHPVYAASYPVNTADESAYSEGRDSPRSVISDDGDCKEREGSVGASDSDVERTGACFSIKINVHTIAIAFKCFY